MPKRRAASRWLSPSTWQAWRTRPYSSTENITAFPGSFRTSLRTAMPRYAFVPPRPDYPAAPVAHFSSAALSARLHEAEEGAALVEVEVTIGPGQGHLRRANPCKGRGFALR